MASASTSGVGATSWPAYCKVRHGWVSLFTGAGGLDLGCEAAGFLTAPRSRATPRAQETLWQNRDRFFPQLADEAIFEDIVDLDYEELSSGPGLEPGEVGPAPRRAALHAVLEERLLARVQARRRGSEGVAARQLRRGAPGHPPEGVPDGERLRARLPEPEPAGPRAVHRRRRGGGLLVRHGDADRGRLRRAAASPAPDLRRGLREDLLDAAGRLLAVPVASADALGAARDAHELRPQPAAARDRGRGARRTSTTRPTRPSRRRSSTGTYAEELRGVPPGDNYLFWTAQRGHPEPRFEWRKRYWTFLLKLHPDRPSPTIQGQPGPWVGPFHWDNRRLRVGGAEAADDVPGRVHGLSARRREQQLQLGNAVPPQLAHVVARRIADELVRLGASDPLLTAA